jgi:hypothetical protein
MALGRRAVLTIRKEPFYRRDAFEKMLAKHGYRVVPHNVHPDSKEDLLILWNRKRGADDNVATEWEARGGTVIVAENGYIQKVDKTYYALSVHGHNGSGWFPVGDEDRFSKLEIEVKPYHDCSDLGYALVCGQRGIGTPLMASPSQWAERIATKLSANGVPTKLRQHPGNFKPKTALTDDLKKARSCVIWSSGSGVRAMVEGYPVFFDAPHWICSDGAWRFNLGLIKHPPKDSDEARAKALHKMAHGQWHFEEIATGEPLARMLAHLGEAKWS